MIYKSKVDWWMKIVIYILPILPLALSILPLKDGNMQEFYIFLGVEVLILFFFWLLVLPIRYQFEESELVISAGKIRTRIPYNEIKKVEPSSNPLSAPALSLDRLSIDCQSKWPILISPDNREGFYRDLMAKAPQLKQKGDSLVVEKEGEQ